jgi:hypothetical protein
MTNQKAPLCLLPCFLRPFDACDLSLPNFKIRNPADVDASERPALSPTEKDPQNPSKSSKSVKT